MAAVCSDEVDDELDSLQSIYDEDALVYVDDENRRCFVVTLSAPNCVASDQLTVKLEIVIPLNYPTELPPLLRFMSRGCLDEEETVYLKAECESLFVQDQVVIYDWLERIKDYLTDKASQLDLNCDVKQRDPVESPPVTSPSQQIPTGTSQHSDTGDRCEVGDDGDSCDGDDCMCHGEPLTDRRSTFQAHVAEIHSQIQLEKNLRSLKSNRKIASATHNIMAYRYFDQSKNVLVQDCDDDGESAAGGRLLHLLQIMDASNVMVVVSRWYGGIQLGPDRFKHINNVARVLLLSSGTVAKKDSVVKRKSKLKRKQ